MLGVILALLAAAGFAGGAIFARTGLQSTKPTTGTLVSVVASFVVAGTIAVAYEPSAFVGLAPIAFLWFLVIGILDYPVARLSNFTSVSMIGAARSQVFVGTQPLFAAGLAVLFLGERPGWPIVVGTVAIVAATGFIVSERQSGAGFLDRLDRRILLGGVLGLMAAVGYGSSTVVAKEVVAEHAKPLVAAAFAPLMGGFTMAAVTGRDVVGVVRIPRGSLVSVALAGVSTGGAVVCLYFSLNRTPVVVVAPMLATVPLITLVVAHLALKRLETITPQVVIGALLVVAGVIVIVLARSSVGSS